MGEGIILDDGSGKLNRPALGKIVFSSPEKLEELNKIVWPHINRELKRRMDEHVEGILVVEAAVMIEAGWAGKIRHTTKYGYRGFTAGCGRAIDGTKQFFCGEARKRINSQITNDERLQHANVAIENNGTQSDLEKKVREQWNSLIERYKLNYSKY